MSWQQRLMARGRNVSDDAQGTDGLPGANTVRWTASRKMAVLRAVAAGQITAEEIARLYAISAEELETWSSDYADHGLRGLQEKGWTTRRRKRNGGDSCSRSARRTAEGRGTDQSPRFRLEWPGPIIRP